MSGNRATGEWIAVKNRMTARRTRNTLLLSSAALAATLGALLSAVVVAARTDNAFMVSVVTWSMVAIVLVLGIFVGKLITLRKP